MIPEALKQSDHWVAWWNVEGQGKPVQLPNGKLSEPLAKQAKPHKLPINPKTGGLAKTDNSKTWSTYATAVAAAAKFKISGVGFVFTDKDPFAGIDLDDCRDPVNGMIEPWALEIIVAINSYTEVSPSFTGVKIFVIGKLFEGARNRTEYESGQVEMYSSRRFFTVTGMHLEGTPMVIEDRQDQLLALHRRVFPIVHAAVVSMPAKAYALSLTDSELVDKAMRASNGASFRALWSGQWNGNYASQSEADLALCCMLAFWTQKDDGQIDCMFRQSGLMRDKWNRKDYRENTIHAAIAQCSAVYEMTAVPRTEGILIQPTMIQSSIPSTSLDEVIRLFRRWLHMPDAGGVEAVLGFVAANLIPGDPVWLLVVGPPGSGKTELLQSLRLLPKMHHASTLTEAGLLSGTPKKDTGKNATGGLLREIGDFGFIVCKDFGSVISMNRDGRSTVLAALREIYDGSWSRTIGVDGGKSLSWQGKIAFLAACTPVIDSHHAVISSMGERFVLYRMPRTDTDEHARSALAHEGREEKMRTALAQAVADLFRNFQPTPLVLAPAEKEKLISLSTLVARCRSSVERDPYSRAILLKSEPEAPTRLSLTLSRHLKGMRAIGVNERESWRVLTKIALDCMPALRLQVFELLFACDKPMLMQAIAAAIGYPDQTTRRVLEDLEVHNVVAHQPGTKQNASYWELSPWTRAKCAAAELIFPEKSEEK